MVGNNNEFPPPPPCPQPKEEGRDAMFVKMMTDQQMEALRKQIAAYSTICEQLEELHMTLLSHGDDHLSSGVKTSNNPYSTNLIGSNSGQKLTRRQRWNPTSEQLLVLERVFYQEGIKTPNPQKVKEITAELAQHGQISEPNVYNWFQNRRARLKKKQIFETEANNLAESLDANVSKSSQNENASTGRNDLARTGNIVPIHSFQACPKPSRDFGRMTSHGRILSWEESHDPPLNSENGKNTDLTSSYSPFY